MLLDDFHEYSRDTEWLLSSIDSALSQKCQVVIASRKAPRADSNMDAKIVEAIERGFVAVTDFRLPA